MRSSAWRLLWLLPAVAMLWLGGTRVAEGWRTWPLMRYVHAAWWQRTAIPSPADLLATPPRRPDGRAWSAYGQALLAVADTKSDPAERIHHLDRADEATRRALRLSPAQAATWARLSLIALNRDDPDLAVAALQRSLTLAPNGVRLAWPRVKLGLYLWPRLNEAAQAGVASDVQRLLQQPASLALPYPDQALARFAERIGQRDLVTQLALAGARDGG